MRYFGLLLRLSLVVTALAIAVPAQVTAEDYLKQGAVHVQAQNWTAAIAAFSGCINVAPATVKCHYLRGIVRDLLRQDQEAVKDFTRTIELDPTLADAYRYRGMLLVKFKRLDEGLADLTKAVQLKPSAVAFSDRASAYLAKGLKDLALADYTKAIELDPKNANALGYRGQLYLDAKQYEKALADLNRSLQIAPNEGFFLYGRGQVHFYLGKKDLGEQDFKRVVELDPKFAEGISAFRSLYASKEKLNSVSSLIPPELLNPAPPAKPAAPPAPAPKPVRTWQDYNDAAVDAYAKDYPAAVRLLTECIQVHPQARECYYTRGYYRYMKGEYAAALPDLDVAVRLLPESQDGYYIRGEALRLSGEYEKAVADYTTALKLYPANDAARRSLAHAYFWLKKYDLAALTFDEVIKKSPNFADYYFRGKSADELGQPDKAIEAYTQAISLKPNDAHFLYLRGIAYLKKGDRPKAITDFRSSLTIDPNLTIPKTELQKLGLKP